MGQMGLAAGYGAGAGADALKELLKQKFIEGQARIRAQEAQQQFGQNQQRIDNDASQFTQRLGLDDRKFGEDTRQFNVTSGQAGERIGLDREMQPVRLKHMTAQTEDLNRQPQEAIDARTFATAQDLAQHKSRMGEIGAQGANTLRAATARQPTGLSPNQALTQTRALQTSYNKIVQPARDMQRQLSAMEFGLEAARNGNLNAGSQAVISTFQKILDPNSVVREAEYDRTPQGMGLMQRMEGILPRLVQGGPGVPPAELEKFAALAREMTDGVTKYVESNAQGVVDLATANGIDPRLIVGAPRGPKAADAAPAATTGAVPADPYEAYLARQKKGR